MEKNKKEKDRIEKYLMECGVRLKGLRKAKGFTNYEQFAYMHNIGRSQYGKYEKGADMRLSTFLRVLMALEISPGEFFNEDFNIENIIKQK